MTSQATIIGIADGTHYLIGTINANGDFIPIPSLSEIKQCNSLSAAKNLLKENSIHSATLTLQSAYDEMCGLPASSSVSQDINF